MSNHCKCLRQGEILFIPINLPKEVINSFVKSSKSLKTKVIREGEVSGHMHSVVGNGKLMEYPKSRMKWINGNNHYLPEGDMYLKADNTIEITHPEHKSLKLDKGDYIIRIQREYNDGRNQQVLD